MRRSRPIVAWKNGFAGRFVGCGDFLAGGRLVNEVAAAVNGRKAAEAIVWAIPVVEVLPLGQACLEIWILEVDGWPELIECSSLDAFHLAV